MDEETRRAQALLESRYVGMRQNPQAEGWYPAEWIPESLREWSEFLRPLRERRGWAVELGCGAGNLALDLASAGWEVAGCDVSASAVEWARSRAASAGLAAEFFGADLGAPLPPELVSRFAGRFDLVLDSDCLHYILGERRTTFLVNARTFLAPGGTFALRTIVGEPAPEEWELFGYEPERRTACMAGVPMTYHARPDEILRELGDAGFEVRESRIVPATGGRSRSDVLLALAKISSGD